MKKKRGKEGIIIFILILIIVLSIATIFLALNSKAESLDNDFINNIGTSSNSGQVILFVEGGQIKNEAS